MRGRAPADHLDEDHGRDDEDERDRDALEREQQAHRDLRRPRREQVHRDGADQGEQERRPQRRVVPDARVGQEGVDEVPERAEHAEAVRDVREQEPPRRDGAGARAERRADQPVDRARVVEVLAQAHERVRDQDDADRGQQEAERHGSPDRSHHALRVGVDGKAGRHEGDGYPDRLPHVEGPPHADPPALVTLRRSHRILLVLVPWIRRAMGRVCATPQVSAVSGSISSCALDEGGRR